ncbi:MAG: DNA primase [Candidatus Vogelbacteria bacterium CG10_big_fil_rev_8_21_14_0_10_49_38]|uniref:DNA primase n=1 Tax=Candidatus Vogelbacteria bacterium CG10_big_fil_rev_8_21_14_0_10_49_38 TaxID=1975043 RepID=A0A2H0RJV2_9BACT|nr:MAG: DNA primase [bacterium CG10_49_38]PIR46055.1 MAG: DNA primase [Candidatus Vogelbacteria bacterium CG10_big_fil_rev_8_21_14_0_10_49_38]
MTSSVEQIKSKLSIVDVVGAYLKLEKAGANYRACCPFHNEKTPSFFVSPARGTYHCFGCHRGGDIFSFVQEIEGADFLDALKTLAERAGVELAPSGRVAAPNKRLYSLLDEATNFYFKQLTQNPPALAYLSERGLTKETIKTWRLGFAPETWRALAEYLAGRGYSEAELLRAGLAVRPAGDTHRHQVGVYDRFRSRLMFPLFDPAGRPVGFSGRIFGADSASGAKYINTPQTEVYDKSALLYGYDRAKQSMRGQDRCVFVEGQLDLLLSHQVGVTNAVAVSGTALSVSHLRLVKRLTERVILAYDYDLAGLSASRRAIDLLRAEGFEVKIAKLPSGQDPAEVIKADPDVWRQALAEAKHYIDFIIDALLEEGKSGLELNLAVNTRVLPYLKALTQKMEQAHFVAKLSQLLRIAETAVWSDLAALPVGATETPAAVTETPAAIGGRSRVVEERLFGLFFFLAGRGQEPAARAALNQVLEEAVWTERLTALEPTKDRLALASELVYDPESDLLAELADLAGRWQLENLKEDQTQVLNKLQAAEQAGDETGRATALQLYRDLTAKINKLKK